MHSSRIALLFLLFICLAVPVAAQEQWLAIEGGTVFDGTGAVHRDAVVLIRGQHIEEVGPADQVPIPAGARRLDATGKFILPGFVDLHFHYDPRTSPWLPLHFLAHAWRCDRPQRFRGPTLELLPNYSLRTRPPSLDPC